jgi:hypothetical protein
MNGILVLILIGFFVVFYITSIRESFTSKTGLLGVIQPRDDLINFFDSDHRNAIMKVVKSEANKKAAGEPTVLDTSHYAPMQSNTGNMAELNTLSLNSSDNDDSGSLNYVFTHADGIRLDTKNKDMLLLNNKNNNQNGAVRFKSDGDVEQNGEITAGSVWLNDFNLADKKEITIRHPSSSSQSDIKVRIKLNDNSPNDNSANDTSIDCRLNSVVPCGSIVEEIEIDGQTLNRATLARACNTMSNLLHSDDDIGTGGGKPVVHIDDLQIDHIGTNNVNSGNITTNNLNSTGRNFIVNSHVDLNKWKLQSNTEGLIVKKHGSANPSFKIDKAGASLRLEKDKLTFLKENVQIVPTDIDILDGTRAFFLKKNMAGSSYNSSLTKESEKQIRMRHSVTASGSDQKLKFV